MNNIVFYYFRVLIMINGVLIIIWFDCGGLIIFKYGEEKL